MKPVSLRVVASANAAFAQERPLTIVVTGGTSGIGEYTIRAIAAHYSRSQQPLRVYIVGRNADSAARIMSDCCNIHPRGDFRFVQATDLSSIRDVDVVCSNIVRQEREGAANDGSQQCIDLLIMGQGDFPFVGRRETSEGLDKSMSLLYYSRMRIAMNLLPLLRASKRAAHVISIYGAGLENYKSWCPDDLLLRQEGRYSVDRYRTHSVMMKSMFMEQLADENAGRVAFVHVFPGLVITPAFASDSHPFWFKVAWAIFGPIAKLFIATSPAEIGERIFFLASPAFPPQGSTEVKPGQGVTGVQVATSTYGMLGGGAYSCDQYSRTNNVQEIYDLCRQQGIQQKVLEHTHKVFQDIEKFGTHCAESHK